MKKNFLPTPEAWRKFILQLGLASTVIAVTLLSVFFSMSLTIALANLLNTPLNIVGFITAILAPAVLGALLGYYNFRLFFRLEEAREACRRLEIIDPLTQIFNRQHFMELGGREFDRARRQWQALSLVFFDIDDFRLVNDAYGHNCGDAVLRQISSICRKGLRKHDIFARYGGEEFVILLSGTSGASAVRAAERIRQIITAQPVEHNGNNVQVTISAGVTTLLETDPDFEIFLQRAGHALSQAKSGGKNCTVAI